MKSSLSWYGPDPRGRYIVEGQLTESTRLDALVALIGAGPAVLDLAGVDYINSAGAKLWLSFVSQLERKETDVVLERCSPVMVEKITLLQSFIGSCKVGSFLVPYHCDKCNADAFETCAPGAPGGPPKVEVLCRCGGTMHLDDLVEYYERLFHDLA